MSKHQMSGMQGVYLVAAEMTRRGTIVSITSRSAKGADLLASNASFSRAWSIQVKTNGKPMSFWLLGSGFENEHSDTHVYVFVNLRGENRPDYYIVPSAVVAEHGVTAPARSTGSVWRSLQRATIDEFRDNWAIFEES